MKITSEHVGRLLEARLERVYRSARPPRLLHTAEAQADRATFSARAEDMRIALAAARASAGEADPRVASLRAKVEAGEYRVSANEVADALLRDLRGC